MAVPTLSVQSLALTAHAAPYYRQAPTTAVLARVAATVLCGHISAHHPFVPHQALCFKQQAQEYSSPSLLGRRHTSLGLLRRVLVGQLSRVLS